MIVIVIAPEMAVTTAGQVMVVTMIEIGIAPERVGITANPVTEEIVTATGIVIGTETVPSHSLSLSRSLSRDLSALRVMATEADPAGAAIETEIVIVQEMVEIAA